MSGALVVPLDGSRVARSALPIADTLARMLGATVHLLHVSDPPLSTPEATRMLHITAPPEGAVVEARSGPPATAILDAARRWDAYAVVMTSHSGRPNPGRGIGDVVDEVLRNATTPVVLVRPERGEGPWVPRIVLLPLDGTPASAAALHEGTTFARRLGATLDLLHVVAPATEKPRDPGTIAPPYYADQPQHEWPAWEREFVERAACHCAPGHESPIRLHVVTGRPGAETVRYARAHGSDLIVLAWHGRFDEDRAATLRGVLEDTPCPVLVLRV